MTSRTLRLIEAYEHGRTRPRDLAFAVVEADFFVLVKACGTVKVKGCSYSWNAREKTVYRQDARKTAERRAQAKKHRGHRPDPAARGVREHRVVGLPAGFVAARCSPTECGIVVGEL